RELRLAVAKTDQATYELDARLAQAVEVDCHALRRANQLERRQAPRPFDVLHGVVADIHGAHRIHPPLYIASAVRARHPDMLSDGKNDATAGGLDLPGELNAAGRGAHDHHAAIWQESGVPVLQRREAGDPGRQSRTERWDRGEVASSARYHKLAATPRTLAGRKLVTFILSSHSHNARSRRDRGVRKL